MITRRIPCHDSLKGFEIMGLWERVRPGLAVTVLMRDPPNTVHMTLVEVHMQESFENCLAVLLKLLIKPLVVFIIRLFFGCQKLCIALSQL